MLKLLQEVKVQPTSVLVQDQPTQGAFYRISKGDSLLAIAGKVYGVGPGGRRLELAQAINAHPFNRRYWLQPKSEFNKKYFPKGFVSFYPRFACNDTTIIAENAPPGKGSCFAVIWIPRETSPALSIHATPHHRAYLPGAKKKHTKIVLTVTAEGLAPGDRILWTPHRPEDRKRMHLVGKTKMSVEVWAARPGLATIRASAIDAFGEKIASTTTRLSVPQFVSIRQDKKEFFKALERFISVAILEQHNILKRARKVAEKLLDSVNVRLVWVLPPFNEKVPEHLIFPPPGKRDSRKSAISNVLEITIRDFRRRQKGLVSYGRWLGKNHGLETPNEQVHLFPGSMRFGVKVLKRLVNLKDNIKDQSVASQLDVFIAKVLGRMIGLLIAKVVLHSLGMKSNAPKKQHPTGDIAQKTIDFDFEDWSGIRVINPKKFPAKSSFKDMGIEGLAKVTAESQAWLDKHFPVPVAFT